MRARTVLAAYCDAVNSIATWKARIRLADNAEQRRYAEYVWRRRMAIADATAIRLARICEEVDAARVTREAPRESE